MLFQIHEFYGLRCLFAICCALCETKLYSAVSTNLNRRVGMLYLIATISSAGMFHAATTFLPSTFAMYTSMLGAAAFIDRRRGFRTAEGVFWFALGGLLGWPFSLAMCIPHIAEELFMAAVSWGMVPTTLRLVKGGIASIFLLVTSLSLCFSHRLTYIPGHNYRNRLSSLPQVGGCTSEHCPIQCIQWSWKRTKHLRHRALVVLSG